MCSYLSCSLVLIICLWLSFLFRMFYIVRCLASSLLSSSCLCHDSGPVFALNFLSYLSHLLLLVVVINPNVSLLSYTSRVICHSSLFLYSCLALLLIVTVRPSYVSLIMFILLCHLFLLRVLSFLSLLSFLCSSFFMCSLLSVLMLFLVCYARSCLVYAVLSL